MEYIRRPNHKTSKPRLRDHNNFQSSGAASFLSCQLPDRQTLGEPFFRQGASGSNLSTTLDLDWLLAAYQSLSQELELDKLLLTLINLILETEMVSQAWLILEKSGDWVIEASGSLESNSIQILKSLPLETAESSLLMPIVNRVLHLQTSLVLNDISQEVDLIPSCLIQPQSLFCFPLRCQDKLIGVLYLENYLITNAFTPAFQELLNRLSPQIAISLNNAYRYNHLHQTVAEQTQAQEQAICELKQTQKKLVQSEKMVALGQLITGIAHEINTPLGAIYASVQNLSNALEHTLEKLPLLLKELSTTQQEDFLTLLAATRPSNLPLSFREERQLKRTLEKELSNHKIEQAETLASMLVEIGITDIEPPLLRLLKASNAMMILETAYYLVLQYRNSENIKLAVDKASTIVTALKEYVHSDRCNCMITAQISEEIDTVLVLYQHQLKQGIQVSTTYENLPGIRCYPEQLNQVWANLIHNAIQAMGSQGKLEITGTRHQNFIRVQITDSGCGIPIEIQDQIFDPFFTTKAAGVGTGLGLDISRQIVEQHQGHIEVESQPGRTSFTVWIPIDHTTKS
ncbi:MAG: ATP-binding protein [Limnoraphis sp.]